MEFNFIIDSIFLILDSNLGKIQSVFLKNFQNLRTIAN